MISLIQLKLNQSAKIVAIEGGQGLVTRLNNLGIREGVTIKKVIGFFGKGPIIVKVGNSQIALGRGMAQKVIVEIQ